jgi:YfiH family protein
MRWSAPGVEVVFTTRQGGVSEGPYASLNLGRMTGDSHERVEENRRRACAALGADAGRLALNRQIHSPTVHRADPGARGEPGDGLWTDEAGVPMLALVADCVPIAIARNGAAPAALAVLHAGRIGILEGVIEAGVAALDEGDLTAAVGPAIGPCCYEVGDEVADPYRRRFGREIMSGRKLDLWTAAERLLEEAGVKTVDRLDICTACNPDLFFSNRRDGKPRGSQGVLGVVTG